MGAGGALACSLPLLSRTFPPLRTPHPLVRMGPLCSRGFRNGLPHRGLSARQGHCKSFVEINLATTFFRLGTIVCGAKSPREQIQVHTLQRLIPQNSCQVLPALVSLPGSIALANMGMYLPLLTADARRRSLLAHLVTAIISTHHATLPSFPVLSCRSFLISCISWPFMSFTNLVLRRCSLVVRLLFGRFTCQVSECAAWHTHRDYPYPFTMHTTIHPEFHEPVSARVCGCCCSLDEQRAAQRFEAVGSFIVPLAPPSLHPGPGMHWLSAAALPTISICSKFPATHVDMFIRYPRRFWSIMPSSMPLSWWNRTLSSYQQGQCHQCFGLWLGSSTPPRIIH